MVFNSVLISIGILMMIYSSYVSIKIYKIFSSGSYWFSFGGRLKKAWSILPIFIIFFLAGYCLYLFFYVKGLSFDYGILTSLIFFFGALFVVIVVSVNYKIFKIMQGGKKSK